MPVSLRELVPVVATVTINGQEIGPVGLNMYSIGYLMNRFPQIRKMLGEGEFSSEQILSMGPEITAAVFAAGTGAPGDPVAEANAKTLMVDSEVAIMNAILAASFQGGAGPFVDNVVSIIKLLGWNIFAPPAASAGDLKTSQDLQSGSNISSPADTPLTPSGDTPPDNSSASISSRKSVKESATLNL